jgi:hypothetical protein
MSLCMGLARAPMPPLADDLSMAHDQTTHTRVRVGREAPQLGQLDRPRHEGTVGTCAAM